MAQVINIAPQIFDDETATESDLLLGHTGENWYRALTVINGYWRLVKNTAKGSEIELETDGTPILKVEGMKKPAIAPIFLTTSDWEGWVTEAQEQSANPPKIATEEAVKIAVAAGDQISEGLDLESGQTDVAELLAALARYDTIETLTTRSRPNFGDHLPANASIGRHT